MSFEILNNPLLTTVQDSGRFSYVHLGVCNSGVMDQFAYMAANELLNNHCKTNILEISFGNVTLKALNPTSIVVTGAQCEFFINDTQKQLWQTHYVRKDDIVKVGKILNGSKVYLSVKKGFTIPKDFGSNSTSLKENLGGIDGNKLKKTNILPFKSSIYSTSKRLQKKFIPHYPKELELRVMLSYQHNSFDEKEKEKFFNSSYTVSNEISSMGYKLHGSYIESSLDGIISEGIAFGSIQIPKDGQPIILLKERQTIGGYPKIGVVLDVDCFKLAQAQPQTIIKFKEISFEDGISISKKFHQFFK